MNNPFIIMLDACALLLVLGLLLAGVYEALAFINYHIAFTPSLPFITNIVRPWVALHRLAFLGITILLFDAFIWLFFHFLIAS